MQPIHQGGQPPSQVKPRATPTGPSARTQREHRAQPDDRPQPEKANHSSHAATDGPEERPTRTNQHRPPQGKRQTTNHGDAETTRTAGRGTEPQKTGGGAGQGDHVRNRQEWPPEDDNTKEPKAPPTGPPPPRNLPQTLTGKIGKQKKTQAGNNTHGDPQTTPHQRRQRPSREAGEDNSQGQRGNTKTDRAGCQNRLGTTQPTQKSNTPEPQKHQPASPYPAGQGDMRINPNQTTHRTTRSGNAGYGEDPSPHAPPANPAK